MIYPILVFILFLLSLPFLFFLWYFQIASFSFQKLGFPPSIAFLILLLTLFGSSINFPLSKKRRIITKTTFFFSEIPYSIEEGIAINLGGAIVPLAVSIYLFLHNLAYLVPILFSLILMIFICKYFSRIVPGVGIAMPALIPPIFSALFALIFLPQNPAPCAYIAGTLGTLIGADLLNLHRVKKFRGMVSIGGAGVFDGIFLTGIISVLLTTI